MVWSSSIEGPIPPHPIYDTKGRSNYCVMPPPRVKGDGEKIAARGQRGCVGNLISMNVDGTGIGPRPVRKMPTNHIQANVKRMRQIQRAAHQRDEELQQQKLETTNKPVKALWKSEKFTHIPSKVSEALQAGNMTPRPVSRDFLRAHSRSGPSRPISRGPSPVPRLKSASSLDQLSVPPASEAKSVQMHRSDFDFIKINGMNARHYGLRRSPSKTALDDVRRQKDEEQQSYRRGAVPQYLLDRKKQWAKEAEERLSNTPDAECPEGHRVMAVNERNDTLQILRERYKKLIDELQLIPLTSDTLRTRNKRRETEQKLEEVEEAVRIFSRPKVFIKIDT